MNRQFIIDEICAHVRSHKDREFGAHIDVVIPWGNHCQISVRVQRMTGKCINLHTDMEMLTIDPEVLDAAFTGQVVTEQVSELTLVGVVA